MPRPSAYVSSFSVIVPTNSSGRLSSACRSATTPSTCGAVGQLARRVDRGAGLARCATRRPRRSSPARSRSGPSPCDSSRRPDSRRCSAIRSRIVRGFCPFSLSSSAGTSGGGGGGGVPSMFSRIHLPRTTGDVRSACDVSARMLPWPEQPLPRLVGDRHAAELAAVDVRDAVVPREPLVDERVVGASADRARCGPRA